MEYRHHGDPLVPRQQRFGAYTRSLMKALDVPVINRWGLRPALVPGTSEIGAAHGLPRPRRAGPAARASPPSTSTRTCRTTSCWTERQAVQVLARQPIDTARPHPFIAAGNSEFNTFLWMPPKGQRAGDIVMVDSTNFTTLFGRSESLEAFWRNLAGWSEPRRRRRDEPRAAAARARRRRPAPVVLAGASRAFCSGADLKKSLLLLCVFGGSASAHAQSSVSLSGTIDVAANRVTGSVASRSQLISGANSSSKLVLRGNEDLGGGMYANFWLESGLNADNGTFQEPSTNDQSSATGPAPAGTQGLTFDRRSFVGLGGTWGEVHMGREESPTYDTFSLKFDLFGVGSGIGLNYTSSINPNQVRMSNDIAYISPKFAGVFANVQHWFGENPSGATTSKDGSGSGISLTYQGGPIYGVVHYARTDFAAGDAIYRGIAAYYDPGAWKIAFNLNRDDQGTLMQRGFNVGGLVRVGNIEYKATYSGLRTSTEAGNPEGRKVAVGYVYKISKRTAIYSTLARIFNKNDSALAIGSATTGPNQPSSAFDIGIRHFF